MSIVVNQEEFKDTVNKLKASGMLYSEIASVANCSDRQLRRILIGEAKATIEQDISIFCYYHNTPKEEFELLYSEALSKITSAVMEK